MPDGSPPELKDSFNALLVPLLLNSALAALKVHPQTPADARVGIDCATRALDRMALNNADKGKCHLRKFYDMGLDGECTTSAKALYRRALAHVVLKEEDAAESDLVAASQLISEDQAVANELTKVRQIKKEKKEKEKKAFKKMFA
jgi:peptidyl-prolyl isomerase D